MSSTFRALRVHQQASGSQARIESLTLADVTPGEVVIRTCWAGVNYKDSLAVTGAAKVLSGSPRVPPVPPPRAASRPPADPPEARAQRVWEPAPPPSSPNRVPTRTHPAATSRRAVLRAGPTTQER